MLGGRLVRHALTLAEEALHRSEAIPPAWLEQLAIGGRLVSPVHQGAQGQVLVVVDRTAEG